MKKLCFGLAFIDSMVSFLPNTNAQESVDPGDGPKWVCCQVNYQSFCTDMSGVIWNQDVQRFGVDTCS